MKPLAPGSERLTNASPAETREWLSALVDGELQNDDQAMQQACALWRSDAQTRQAWHTYHLIGDVLRSDELAASPARDAAFVASLRAKLATEPVVMAPTAAAAGASTPGLRGRHRLGWLAPAAVAAGFVAVAGVLVVARIGLSGAQPAGAVQALAPAVPSNLALAGVPATRLPAAQGAAVIRDARLDSYLRAHQAARGGGGAAAPGGGLRSVEVILPPGAPR